MIDGHDRYLDSRKERVGGWEVQLDFLLSTISKGLPISRGIAHTELSLNDSQVSNDKLELRLHIYAGNSSHSLT